MLIFSLPNRFSLPSPLHHAHNSSSFLLLINTGTHNTQKQSLSPFAPHSITLLLGEQFWLIYIDCYGPFPIPAAPEQKKKSKPSHSSKQHLPDSSPREQQSVFFSFFFSLPHSLCFVLDKYLSCPKESGGSGDLRFVHFFNNTFNTL